MYFSSGALIIHERPWYHGLCIAKSLDSPRYHGLFTAELSDSMIIQGRPVIHIRLSWLPFMISWTVTWLGDTQSVISRTSMNYECPRTDMKSVGWKSIVMQHLCCDLKRLNLCDFNRRYSYRNLWEISTKNNTPHKLHLHTWWCVVLEIFLVASASQMTISASDPTWITPCNMKTRE